MPIDTLISIEDLLEKELQCRTLPCNGKLYPEGDGNYVIIAKLLHSELTSPYATIDVLIPEKIWNKAIAQFTLSGVVYQDKKCLAFKYEVTVRLPTAVSNLDEVKKDIGLFIHSEQQAAYGKYLHFMAMLRPDATVMLLGKVFNSEPRLFLPQGMALQAGEFQATHGFTGYHYRNNPAYR